MTDAATSLRPIASDDVPWATMGKGTRFGIRYRHLSLATIGEGYRVGVAIEELEPGRQSGPAHYHLREEEHVFVLDGTVTVRIGERLFDLAAGGYVCFPAGQPLGHCLINRSDRVCRYVILGERHPDDVVIYTETGKIQVRRLGSPAIFDMAETRDYWEGEDTGVPAETPKRAVIPVSQPVDPKLPVSTDDLLWHDETTHGDRFGGRAMHLTGQAVGDGYHVGVLIESPAPGRRLCPRHYHMAEEEHALILEGEMTLLLGDEALPMRPGDFVSFPAGRKVGHSLMNSGSGPCRYLMIGESNPDDVCVYPDSNKVFVRGLRQQASVFDMAATRRYFDGE